MTVIILTIHEDYAPTGSEFVTRIFFFNFPSFLKSIGKKLIKLIFWAQLNWKSIKKNYSANFF